MRVVQAAPVDANHHLGPRFVERLALKLLDRLAAHLAVQVTGAGSSLEPGERRLVRRSPGHDDESAAAGGAGGAERDRLGGAADDDTRRDAALELQFVVEEHRPLRVRFGRRVADELERLIGKLEQQLPTLVLEDRPQLHEIGDEPSQARVRRQPAIGEGHGYPRSLVRDPELAADRPRGSRVEYVRVHVWLVSASWEEPGLDGPLAPHALDPSAALREPHVAQAASEETALPRGLGNDAERPEALIDGVGVDAFAVV